MLRFRRMRSLQKFAAVHSSVHNHFNKERHLCSRKNFKLPDVPIPVHGVTGLAYVNGWIHLPGGGTRMGGSSGGTQHQVVRPGMRCD